MTIVETKIIIIINISFLFGYEYRVVYIGLQLCVYKTEFIFAITINYCITFHTTINLL